MTDVSEWEIVALHAAVFGISRAEAEDRVSHRDGLEAAVVRPGNYRHYRDADVALQAAALAHGIAERQVFVDGNKRTAALSMLYFLEENGFHTSASEDDRYEWMIRMAHGWSPDELGEALRPTLRPIGPHEASVQPLASHRRRPRTVSAPTRSAREL